MKILFIRSPNAFLPEIDAYIEYFNNTGELKAYDSSEITREYQLKDFDVVWEFKGFGGVNGKNQILVHEYASLSTGGYPKLKNFLKSKLNIKPNLRVFLNETVRSGFSFNDKIDFCFRDMGISRIFLNKQNYNKEFDFVYIGVVSKSRGIDKMLKAFTEKDNGKLCIIGTVEDDIYQSYKNNINIVFIGKIPYKKVPEIAAKAEYGINFIPDKYPFNIQTSTKLLEYLALNLKVITTDYKWVNDFEKKQQCMFYKLNCDNLIFDIDKIRKHHYISNFKTEDFLWNNIIDKSNIKSKIKEIYKHF